MHEKKSLGALTGIRFVAAATVFIHHLGGKFGYSINRYSIGSLAVTFFFVLSGFILTYVYHDKINNRSGAVRFFFNRFARIWPLHVVCLVIAAATHYGGFSWVRDPDLWPKLAINLALLQSWVPANDWVFSFNGVSWSISTEAFFYLVFPIIIFGNGRRVLWRLLSALTLVALAIVVANKLSQTNMFPGVDFYRMGHVNPLVRLPEFCFGIFAGMIFVRRQNKTRETTRWLDTFFEISIIAAIVYAAVWVSDNMVQMKIQNAPWGSKFLASWFRVSYPTALFAIAIYILAVSKGILANLFSRRLLVYLGDVSYAFYMIHFVVLRSISSATLSYGELPPALIATMAFAMSLGMSIVLYEFVEMPAKHALSRLFNSRFRTSENKKQAKISFGKLSAKAIAAFTLIGVAATTLFLNATVEKPEIAVKTIVRNSPAEIRNIDFGSQIRLLGGDVLEKPKSLEIRLAWAKRIDFSQRRLVIVLDSDGKQIARGKHNQKVFQRAQNGDRFEDVVYLPYQSINDGHEVILCFREKGKDPLPVNRGERRNRNKSLVIIDSKTLSQFKQSANIRSR